MTFYVDLTQLSKPQITPIMHPQTGQLVSLIYSQNGQLHRTDGPAEIHFDTNGQQWAQIWSQNGKYHREDGPAVMFKQHPIPQGQAAIDAQGKFMAEWHFNGQKQAAAFLDPITFNKHWHKGT